MSLLLPSYDVLKLLNQLSRLLSIELQTRTERVGVDELLFKLIRKVY
jgi:hypothetical protein